MHFGPEILDDDAKLNRFISELLVFAVWRIQAQLGLDWRKKAPGLEAEDIVNLVLLELIKNIRGEKARRKWDGQTCIRKWCGSQINSEINNYITKMHRHKEKMADAIDYAPGGYLSISQFDPETSLISREQLREIRSEFSNDAIITSIINQYIENGIMTKDQLAKNLEPDRKFLVSDFSDL